MLTKTKTFLATIGVAVGSGLTWWATQSDSFRQMLLGYLPPEWQKPAVGVIGFITAVAFVYKGYKDSIGNQRAKEHEEVINPKPNGQ